jgi:hypothetical protein
MVTVTGETSFISVDSLLNSNENEAYYCTVFEILESLLSATVTVTVTGYLF